MGAPKTPAPAELKSKNWLEHAYLVEARTGPDIARELGLRDASLVYRYLDRHKIPRRPRNSRRGFAKTVEESIAATRKMDQRYKRRPTIALFMARVRAVIAAKAAEEHIAVRGGLIDLAALCQAWAEEIPFTLKEGR